MLKTAFKQWVCALLVLSLPMAAPAQQESPSIPSAATEFIQLILSRAGSPSAVAVTFQNLAAIPTETQESLQNAMFNAFRSANVRLVKPEQAVADVQITFSEDWQGYVWIANIQQGSGSQLVIKKLPRQQRTVLRRLAPQALHTAARGGDSARGQNVWHEPSVPWERGCLGLI